jgi:hypothetical protein
LKVAGTLLVCGALAFGVLVAPSLARAAAPVGASSPAATPSPTPDPAIRKRAQTMFAQLQAGKIDRSQLDSQANATIDDATIKRAHDAVAPLGTPVTFEQQNVFVRQGISNYVYLVTFGGSQSLDFGFLLDSAGKVAGMAILPPQ